MRDYLDLETTPYDEPCAQVGEDDYAERAKLEARAFINQLERMSDANAFGERRPSNGFGIKSCPHDFGTYYEVRVYYNDEDEQSFKYADEVQANGPGNWDEAAVKELTEN